MSLEGCEIIEILNASVPLAASGLSSSFSQAAAEAWNFLAPGFYLVLGPAARGKIRQRLTVPLLVGPLPSRIAAEALRISAYALDITAPRRQGQGSAPTLAAEGEPRPTPLQLRRLGWRLATCVA
ncbi:MAG TPA: hypothetical protein VJ548_13075 [Azospira sp.]|nr:hypothetical protein [Azospira sp.]